jgi:hypothetical protein
MESFPVIAASFQRRSRQTSVKPNTMAFSQRRGLRDSDRGAGQKRRTATAVALTETQWVRAETRAYTDPAEHATAKLCELTSNYLTVTGFPVTPVPEFDLGHAAKAARRYDDVDPLETASVPE